MGRTQRSCFNFKFKPSSHSREDVVPPQDVRDLFSQYAGEARDMGEEDLRRYLLKASQAGAAGHDDVANVVDRLLEQIFRQGPGSRRFTLDDFHRILFSHDLNPPIRHQHVHQDMTLPLSQYFIYTAPNPDHTRPNQLRRGSGGRRSDDDHIVWALKMGVRAIEVSMWPNSKQDDIVSTTSTRANLSTVRRAKTHQTRPAHRTRARSPRVQHGGDFGFGAPTYGSLGTNGCEHESAAASAERALSHV